jgi:hypothetical protein
LLFQFSPYALQLLLFTIFTASPPASISYICHINTSLLSIRI